MFEIKTDRQCLSVLIRVEDRDLPCRPIDTDPLTVLQPARRLVHSHHCWNSIFPRDNRTMRHHATDFGNESACCHEEWGPCRVGAGANEDLARCKLRLMWVEHHMDNTFHHTG